MDSIRKICINCPAGCHLEIIRDGEKITVSGNTCPRGIKYAEQELADPRRTVTAVVMAAGNKRVCIPVKTTQPIPMKMIDPLLKKLFSMRLELPVQIGQVIISNIENTGISVIATSDCF